MRLRSGPFVSFSLLATAAALSAGARLPAAWDDPALAARSVAAPRMRLLEAPAGVPLAPAREGSPDEIARAFLTGASAAAAKVSPVPGELALLSVVEGGGGVRFVTFEQRFDGVPVWLGRISVAVARDGSVVSARMGALATEPPRAPETPRITTPAQALAVAQSMLGNAKDAPAGPRPTAKPVIVATTDGSVRAWRVDLCDHGQADRRVGLTFASSDARLLAVTPLVLPGVAKARVTRRDPTAGFTLEDCVDPVTAPSTDSPAGWSFGTETSGNNTFVQLDREADWWPPYGALAQATGTPPALDFAFTGDPRNDSDAALTNVFWLVNDAHDRLRRLGFDEASGACQADSFGRGGRAGDDRIWSLVQYASQDGSQPYQGVGLGIGDDGGFAYLVVGVFQDSSGNLRDAAFEADLVDHELAHEASVRMVGGDPACFDGAQPQAISEGTSDFLAASFTDDPVIGAWTSGNPLGVRSGPIGGTGVSLVNICESGCDRYRDGEIWAGLLWDVRQEWIRTYGRARGIEMIERLVVESLRYAPCRPTFVDARDALLLADDALWGGSHRCDLWQLFVNRGLGASATTSGPDDARPFAGYDLPAECSGGESVAFQRNELAPDDDGVVEVVDATPGASPTVTLTATGGDSLTLPLAAVPGGPLLRAAFTLVPGAPAADGVLQAAAGETITATYGRAAATAGVTDGMVLPIVEHHVYGTWCQMNADDDSVDGWWVLPGFLDPGEEATVAVTLGNGLGVDLQDCEVTVTSLSPLVRVLPSAPIRLGTVRAQDGTAPRRFEVDFKATGALSATPGSTADVRLDFRSRGRTGSATLTLELAMDYVVETGRSPFDGGTETFDPRTSSTVGQWTTTTRRGTSNSWRREDCAGRNDVGGWHVGEPGCAEYQDGQVATSLESPPIFSMPPDTAAFRLADWSWSVDSHLFTDPANPLCEADFVGLFVTADPASLDWDRKDFIYSGQAQRYWRPLYEDTNGWTTQSPFYYSNGPQLLPPGADLSQLRFVWGFWGDVYDCGFELANHGRFALDDVRFTYDVVRKVPETQACTGDCVLYAPLVADPPGPKCPGEAFMLRATGWEQLDCPGGAIHYGFAGPGVPASGGWTTTPESPATGEDGGTWTLYSQCDASPDCNDWHAMTLASPAAPGVGTILPGTLRVTHAGASVAFAWMGAAAPPSYGVWRASTRAELASPLDAWTLVGRTDTEGPRGEGSFTSDPASLGPALCFFRVAGRDRCSDAPRP